MKRISRTLRLVLPLAAGLSLWAGFAQADAPASLKALSAKLQGAALKEQDKSLSAKLALSPVMTSLAGSSRNFVEQSGSKRLRIDPRLKFAPASKNQLSVQFRTLALHLGQSEGQDMPVKNLNAQISALPSWESLK
jgi:hypothetical protein